MSRVFGDTHYFLALINPRDAHHERATALVRNRRDEIFLTRWILAEVAMLSLRRLIVGWALPSSSR
jgi:predicted nucleic acid-binding protein